MLIAEPIGSSPPNVPKGLKGNIYSFTEKSQISLTCPAQAFPVPAFRYSIIGRFKWLKLISLTQSRLVAQLQMFQKTRRGISTALPKRHNSLYLALLRDTRFQHSGRSSSSLVLTLVFTLTEPIGSSPPNVPKESKSNTFGFVEKSQVSLTCPAQGFPTPSFR